MVTPAWRPNAAVVPPKDNPNKDQALRQKTSLLGRHKRHWCDSFVRNRPYRVGGWAVKNGHQLFFNNCRLMLVR